MFLLIFPQTIQPRHFSLKAYNGDRIAETMLLLAVLPPVRCSLFAVILLPYMTDFTAKRAAVKPARMVSGAAFDDDARLDASVRPKTLDEYIGQKRVKENIAIAIEAARTRGEALDHVLLYGPPGLGKTT